MNFKPIKKPLIILFIISAISILSFNTLTLKSNGPEILSHNWEKYGPNTPKVTRYIQNIKMRRNMETMFHAGDPTIMLLKNDGHSNSCKENCKHSKKEIIKSTDNSEKEIVKSTKNNKKEKWIKVTPIFYIPKSEINKVDKIQGKAWRAQTKEAQGESNKILVKRLTKYQKRDPFQFWIYHDIAYFCVNFFFRYELALNILEEGWENWEKLLDLAKKHPKELEKNGRMIQLQTAQMDISQICLLAMWFSEDNNNKELQHIWENRFDSIVENYKYTYIKTKEYLESKGENTEDLTLSDVVKFKEGTVDNLTYTLYLTTWNSIEPMISKKIKLN